MPLESNVPTAGELLRRIAAWDLAILGGLGCAVSAAFAAAGRNDMASGVLVGFLIVAFSSAALAWVAGAAHAMGSRAGAILFGGGYAFKMLLIIVVLSLLHEWTVIDLRALLVSTAAAVVGSLVTASWMVVRSDGPSLDVPSREELERAESIKAQEPDEWDVGTWSPDDDERRDDPPRGV